MSERSAVIVGGGLAGIAAALDLKRAGAKVTLLEVRPRLGGAAYSFERDGLWLDNGQHVFLRCCSAYRELLERLGTTADTVLQDRLRIPVLAPGGRLAWLKRVGLPAPLHLASALLRYTHLSPRERLSVALSARRLARVDPDDPAADRESFGAWLSQARQSARAVEALWELISRPTLNLRAGETSLAAAAFVFRTGLLERAENGDIGYARVPLQRVHGDAALKTLEEQGVDVRLGFRVSEIEPGFSVAGQGERLKADAVILAVPNDRALGLLPAGALKDPAPLKQLGSSPIVNLHIAYDRPVLKHEFAAAIGSPAQFIFDRTASAGLQRGQCLAVSLSAADAEIETPPDQLQRQFTAAIEELLPAASQAKVERFVVTRERFATPRLRPGTWRSRPGPETGIEGFALAGAWTDTGWPATMEGAVRSGHAAARVALKALGRERAIQELAA
jgi:squalene-associated FAD-dependent desaturase